MSLVSVASMWWMAKSSTYADVGIGRQKLKGRPVFWRFFYPGPGRLHPGSDRLVVSFDGLAGGALAAPAERAQDLPDVSPVVGDPGHGLDDASHTDEGPQVGGEALRAGTLAQRLLHGLELGG